MSAPKTSSALKGGLGILPKTGLVARALRRSTFHFRLASCSLWILLFVFLVSFSPAADAPTDWSSATASYNAANELYAKEDFAGALKEYERLYRSGFGTREVLGNAGNAAYRKGDIGQAVLFYHRALRVDPSYAHARENLERIQPTTNTEASGGAGFGQLVEQWFRSTPGWIWVVIFEVLFIWLLIALAWTIRRAPGSEERSAWRNRAATALVLAAVFFGLASLHGRLTRSAGNAVIVQDKTVSRLGPGENFYEQLELPAGTVVSTRGTPKNGWIQFVLRDGSSGYVPTSSVESI